MPKIVLFFLLTFWSFTNFSQQTDSLIKVTDRLYFISGLGGNVTFLTTDSGVLVVDAGTTERDGKIISNHIKTVTDKPIKYLIYSHYHFDHALGASGITDNPIIIGHINTIKNFKEYGYDLFKSMYLGNMKLSLNTLKTQMDSLKNLNSSNWKDFESQYNALLNQLNNDKETQIEYPDITFKKELNIILNTDTIKLFYPQSTHTDCSILVEFTNQKALATGDFCWNKMMPFIDFNANCDTENWVKQTKEYANQGYDIVIPGHGKIGNSDLLFKQGKYLDDLRTKIKSLIEDNKTLVEIQKTIQMEEYNSYDYQSMLPVEIEAIYKEFTER